MSVGHHTARGGRTVQRIGFEQGDLSMGRKVHCVFELNVVVSFGTRELNGNYYDLKLRCSLTIHR